jgi:hypothetical protein
MAVIGYTPEGYPVLQQMHSAEGDVLGDVLGVARRRAHHPHHQHHQLPAHHAQHVQIPHRPDWREQMAPGVIMPDEGMVPLPLSPQANGGFFDTTFNQITFQGQLQKPFRPERLLVSTVRNGASSVGRLLTQLFVGTDLQGGDITQWDAELIGQANAFGTRMTCKAAEPGVLVRMIVSLSQPVTGTDTVFATMTWLGRIIH